MPVSCQDNISQCYLDSIISVTALFCRPQMLPRTSMESTEEERRQSSVQRRVDLILKPGACKSPYARKSLDGSNCLNPGTFALCILISMELITYVEVPVSSFTVPSDKYANRYKQGGILLSA